MGIGVFKHLLKKTKSNIKQLKFLLRICEKKYHVQHVNHNAQDLKKEATKKF
jgi:hypothetical protein